MFHYCRRAGTKCFAHSPPSCSEGGEQSTTNWNKWERRKRWCGNNALTPHLPLCLVGMRRGRMWKTIWERNKFGKNHQLSSHSVLSLVVSLHSEHWVTAIMEPRWPLLLFILLKVIHVHMLSHRILFRFCTMQYSVWLAAAQRKSCHQMMWQIGPMLSDIDMGHNWPTGLNVSNNSGVAKGFGLLTKGLQGRFDFFF